MSKRREQRIEPNSERILYHNRDYAIKKRATHFETRIEVNFDKPWLELFVKHEIKAKNLEIAFPSILIDYIIVGFHHIQYY